MHRYALYGFGRRVHFEIFLNKTNILSSFFEVNVILSQLTVPVVPDVSNIDFFMHYRSCVVGLT